MVSTALDEQQLRELLFKFDGRLSRSAYWLAWLVWTILSVVLVAVFFLLAFVPYLAICVGLIAIVLMLNSYIAVSRKRLHDRGKSGWWLLLFILVPGILDSLAESAGPLGEGVLEFFSFAIFIWMIVELGCLAGASGPNQYGPDPLAPAQTADAESTAPSQP